jgi:hypothetical protein
MQMSWYRDGLNGWSIHVMLPCSRYEGTGAPVCLRHPNPSTYRSLLWSVHVNHSPSLKPSPATHMPTPWQPF